MRPRPIVTLPPLSLISKPVGVSSGTTQRPMMSIVSERQRRSRISFHSFQSASNWTRPCCISTLLKSLTGLKRWRLISELIRLLGFVRFHKKRRLRDRSGDIRGAVREYCFRVAAEKGHEIHPSPLRHRHRCEFAPEPSDGVGNNLDRCSAGK